MPKNQKKVATITHDDNAAELLEKVVIEGDLDKLTTEERLKYYSDVCRSVNLNPLTRPFEYIKLNNKLTLYAKRDCADQLRKLHGVSIKVLSKELVEGIYTVSVAAIDKHGRSDEDIGSVNIAGARGENRANAMLKAMTKAKRRVTLSICGLGWLTEEEVDDIPKKQKPTQSLDELFPTDSEEPSKTDTPESPQNDVKELPVVELQKTPDASPAASEGPTGLFVLVLDGESHDMDTPEEFFTEYLKQLKFQKANGELGTCRERMTILKEFEKANMLALDATPPEYKAKLIEWRKQLNRQLGQEKKKEETT